MQDVGLKKKQKLEVNKLKNKTNRKQKQGNCNSFFPSSNPRMPVFSLPILAAEMGYEVRIAGTYVVMEVGRGMVGRQEGGFWVGHSLLFQHPHEGTQRPGRWTPAVVWASRDKDSKLQVQCPSFRHHPSIPITRSLKDKTSWIFFWVLGSFERALELDPPHPWPSASTQVTSRELNAETKDTALRNQGGREKMKKWSLPLWAREKVQNVLFTARSHLGKSSLHGLLLGGWEKGGLRSIIPEQYFPDLPLRWNLTLVVFEYLWEPNPSSKYEMCCHWGFWIIFPWLRQQRQSKNCLCLQENLKFSCPKFFLLSRKLIIN